MPQKVPLRSLTELEQQQLQRITKASSERIDVVRRAKALLALAQGHTFTEAGKQAGLSRQAVAQLVERFHQRGIAAVLTIAPGRGRKLTYHQEVRVHILRTVQRPPDRQVDGTATWSLKTLERTLRRELNLPQLCAHTIHLVLLEAGYTSQQSRTWCPTGTAERVRKEGVVVVHDPHTQEKKDLIEQAYRDGEDAGIAVLLQEESYTSKASFLDSDPIPTYQANRSEKPVFSGRRIARSWYQASDGTVIHADINGSWNILRKSSSDLLQLGRGVAGAAVRPRRLAV